MTGEDFEVHESGTFKTLCDKDLEIARLKDLLQQIVELDSCLLADAQEIAREGADSPDKPPPQGSPDAWL